MENFSEAPTNYASFGRRFVALLIDGLILGVIQFVIIAPILGMIGFGAASNVGNLENMTDQQALGVAGAMAGAGMAINLVSIVVQGVYFILMESSARQATVGKMAMGIQVTDLNGNRITPMAAFLRYIGRIVSAIIIFIGYIMAVFTPKKQALHDMIANTLVLKP
jgi:uncharacterized RDD family membrane protein YckC